MTSRPIKPAVIVDSEFLSLQDCREVSSGYGYAGTKVGVTMRQCDNNPVSCSSMFPIFQVECSEYPVQKPVKKCAEVPKQTCVKRRIAPTCREVTKHICRQEAMSIFSRGLKFPELSWLISRGMDIYYYYLPVWGSRRRCNHPDVGECRDVDNYDIPGPHITPPPPEPNILRLNCRDNWHCVPARR